MKKNIVITGADRALGYELAKQYLEGGNRVFAGKFLHKWKNLDELKACFPDTLRVIPLDVRSDESVKAFSDVVRAATDQIDILINNAGIWLGENSGTILDAHWNFDDMKLEYDVNTLGPARMVQQLAPLVSRSATKLIVMITSICASAPETFTDSPGYLLSKVGLNTLSLVMENVLKDQGIQTLLLHPGWMLSWMCQPPITGDEPVTPLPDLEHEYLPDRSAACLIRLMEDPNRYIQNGFPAYLNTDGTPLPWQGSMKPRA